MAVNHLETPIFRRTVNPRIFHKLSISADDYAAADAIEDQTDEESHIDNGKYWMNLFGPPTTLYVGDSHMAHLRIAANKHVFPDYQERFLSKSYFVRL